MNTTEQINLLKTFSLISAILNLITAIVWAFNAILGGLIFCGIGCLAGVLPVVSIIACTMDFISYNKLSGMSKTGTYSTLQFAGIFDAISILTFNILSAVYGVYLLVVINKPEFKNFLRERGLY